MGSACGNDVMVFLVELQQEIIPCVNGFVKGDVADFIGNLASGNGFAFEVECFGAGRCINLHMSVTFGPYFPLDDIARIVGVFANCLYISEFWCAGYQNEQECQKTFRCEFRHVGIRFC